MEFLHGYGWGLKERGVMRDGYLRTVVCSVCTYSTVYSRRTVERLYSLALFS